MSDLIFPLPRWYFTEILFRSRNAALVLWLFMRNSLDTGVDQLEMSYVEISKETGLQASSISSGLDHLYKTGVVKKIGGARRADGSSGTKMQFELDWSAYGTDRKKVFSAYKVNNGSSQTPPAEPKFLTKPGMRKIQEILNKGEAVREGRFGEEKVEHSKQWYSVGYNRNNGVSEALDKVKRGEIKQMRWRDFYFFYQEAYLSRYGEHYIENMKGWIHNILQNLMKKLGNQRLFLIIHWLVNVQTIYKKPTLQLLGSTRHFRAIYEGALQWERTQKAVKEVFQKGGK